MSEITAQMVKELREKTGVGMMDAKKALVEQNGDMDAAIDALRKAGLSKAAKKAGRAAAEGLVGAKTTANCGAVLEINAETDFVARNEQFQQFVDTTAQIALEQKGELSAIQNAPYPGGSNTVSEALTGLIATIGENMSLRRAAYLEVNQGTVVSYIHNATDENPQLGKIAVIVALESDKPGESLEQLGRQLAMHIAATSPLALTQDGLDSAVVAREKEIVADQARQSGKPENIIEKMVEGRMRKYYEEVVLMDQTFVIDGETKIADVIQKTAKELGGTVNLAGYVRYGLGEGIEKNEDNLAEEVQKMVS